MANTIHIDKSGKNTGWMIALVIVECRNTLREVKGKTRMLPRVLSLNALLEETANSIR